MSTYGRSTIYIGSGMKNAQYTVRCRWVHIETGLANNRIQRGDNYICNAGRDWNHASEKAKAYAKEQGHQYVDVGIFGLNPYDQFTEEELAEYKAWQKRIKNRKGWYGYLQAERRVKKEIEDKARRDKWREEELRSSYQGEIKDRIERTMTVLFTKESHSQYGTQLWVVFADTKGNRYQWNCSSPRVVYGKNQYSGTTNYDEWWYELQRGITIKLKGTVKKHTEYKDVKQTVLTRCKYEVVQDRTLEEKKHRQSDTDKKAV